MSWDHGTYGWEAYESFVATLALAGIQVTEERKEEAYVRGQDMNCGSCGGNCDFDSETEEHTGERCECCRGVCGHKQNLRIGRFVDSDGRRMVVEEYLAIDDRDCDGRSLIAISLYEEGHRLNLATQVFPSR